MADLVSFDDLRIGTTISFKTYNGYDSNTWRGIINGIGDYTFAKGMDDLIPLTLRETGIVIGVGQERARQIEAKAHRKVRHPARFKKLTLPKRTDIMNPNYENHIFIFMEEIPNRYYGYNPHHCDRKLLGTVEYPINELDEAIRDSKMPIDPSAVRSINTSFEYSSLVPRNIARIIELTPAMNDDIVAYTEVIVRIQPDPQLAMEKEKDQKERARKCSEYVSANRPRSTREVMFGQMHGDFDGDPLEHPTEITILSPYIFPPGVKPF
jgi:hypothetical protein